MPVRKISAKRTFFDLLGVLWSLYLFIGVPVFTFLALANLFTVNLANWNLATISHIDLSISADSENALRKNLIWLSLGLTLARNPKRMKVDLLQLGIASFLIVSALFMLTLSLGFTRYEPPCLYEGCWPMELQKRIAISPYIAGVVAMAAMALLAQKLHLIYRALIPPLVFLVLLGLLKLSWPSILEHLLSLT